jgi:hypothetical protein
MLGEGVGRNRRKALDHATKSGRLGNVQNGVQTNDAKLCSRHAGYKNPPASSPEHHSTILIKIGAGCWWLCPDDLLALVPAPGLESRMISQCQSRVAGRPPCRRWGQSHWPHPTAVPAQGIVLQHSAGENCAGRRLLYVSMWFDNRTVTNFCLHASIVPVGPSGGPLFDRPKRGRKKPHQPALAHCVRVAGLYALRLTALPRVRATNRLPDSRRALLRDKSVRDAAPRKARERNRQPKERKAGGTALVLFYVEKSVDREKVSTRDWD